MSFETASPVIVTVEELQNGIDDATLSQAFGPNSLGIILVKGLPDHFQSLREKVLKSASILSNLPEEQLRDLECEESVWLIGWSCGKEKLASTGKPDYNKGSFYVNCAFHNDDSLEGPSQDLVEKFPKHKAYTESNKWPEEKSELINFKSNMKELCNLIINVAALVALNCDQYIKKIYSDYEAGFLGRIVNESTCTKARLLHYFPSKSDINGTNNDDWCGEHLDHSCLTGLTSALFIDESEGKSTNLTSSPDPSAGLYIKNRDNKTIKVNIPSNCLAFQSGSALEEVSKGKFKAVPHFVKGTSQRNIARNTLAVFCQPNLNEKINDTENFAQYSDRILKENH
ncbi:uncharacterized protein KGF55_003867 [Candida pseudojiufengensis]|uniref:uncharacterized protein n=1 Tax=Candida pseudojiufengensis TaxID=497109 RepID=UPI0022245C2A|nr:uncharacterized protein KGF55_003867 [Candida pseudojiufengensis]KAI5961896.1 hypothetical protein KGF55_003867 [Candida pseudojiufengensis]